MRLARAAALIAGAYILSNLTGFVARILIARLYGTGAEADAFRAAFQIPDLLFSLLAGGALGSAFIPAYSGRLATGRPGAARALLQRVAVLTTLGMGALALLAALLAGPLAARVVGVGFDPGSRALTAELMRIMLIGTVIFSLSGLLMGVLQSHDAYLAPALAPAVYQLGLVLGATVFQPFGVRGLAYGVVVGALGHLAVQIPALLRLPPATPDGSTLAADTRQVLRQMAPRTLGLGATRLNFVVNTRLASAMAVGSVAVFDQAFAILVLPIAMAGQAVGTALFPAISAAAARGERAAFGAALTRALGVVNAFALPAMVGLIALGEPLIRVLFEHGSFGPESTRLVAGALAWLSVGLLGHSALEIVTRGFYALRDSLRPALLSVLSMVANIALSLAFIMAFSIVGAPPIFALGLANALATLGEALILVLLLRRQAEGFDTSRLLRGLAVSGLAALGMGLGLLAWRGVAGEGALATLVALPLAAALYLGLAWLLRGEDALDAVRLVRQRVFKR